MPLIYITGPSGAGKSTVRNELVKRGYEAHDCDEDDISAWRNNLTHEIVEFPIEHNRSADWYQNHIFVMSEDRVIALADRAKTKPVFPCGLPGNGVDLARYFDIIICLVIDKRIMRVRLAARDDNDFGKTPDELALILYWFDAIINRYKNLGSVVIDANRLLNTVLTDMMAVVNDQ